MALEFLYGALRAGVVLIDVALAAVIILRPEMWFPTRGCGLCWSRAERDGNEIGQDQASSAAKVPQYLATGVKRRAARDRSQGSGAWNLTIEIPKTSEDRPVRGADEAQAQGSERRSDRDGRDASAQPLYDYGRFLITPDQALRILEKMEQKYRAIDQRRPAGRKLRLTTAHRRTLPTRRKIPDEGRTETVAHGPSHGMVTQDS